ncbi:MAG: class IV adenylate cyclase [Planctomycetota bacterium]
MFTEIEAKLKVDSLPEVEQKLAALGAEFLAEQVQRDYHFDNAAGTLAGSDKCLRLRRQAIGDTEKFYLTYKGAKEKSDFKKRPEIETEIADADSAEKLLAGLGYEKVFAVEKKRRLWKFCGCEVALDELPSLGDFIEIEGPDDEKIAEVQQRLGLAHLPHIPKSYAQLLKEGLRRREV